jgi:hypothetical protein
MAEARALKLREYHTNVIAHDDNLPRPATAEHRNTNTIRSQALSHEPGVHPVVRSRMHENIFVGKPMAAGVTRASYQDSNIFNVERITTKTVQKASLSPQKPLVQRDTNTFRSNVFQPEPECDQTKVRNTNTTRSSVFAHAVQNRINRKKLGGDSKGTEILFGQD